MSAAIAGEIAFRPVSRSDLPMLADWLAQPHWREWWGDPDLELGYIRDMVEGRDPCRPFIILVDGAPSGYIQVWEIGLHQIPEWTADHPWLMELPADAVGVDLSLSDASRLAQGLGSAALRQFVHELREQGHRTIVIDPDPSNERAVACYRKAGFRPAPHLQGRTPGVLIMLHQPDAQPT